MESEKEFNKFDSKLKKYSTAEVIKTFAKFDRDYFNDKSPLPRIKQFGEGVRTSRLFLQPWFYTEIIFYSIRYNDYRSKITEDEAWQLYGLYHNYNTCLKDEFSKENYSNPEDNILPYIMYGYMQEQAIYEISLYSFVNRFNRNYYLLKDHIFGLSNLNTIISKIFQTDLQTYVNYLHIVTLMSISYPVLNSEIVLQCINDKGTYLKIIDSMSFTYTDCRQDYSKIANKDMFRIKPIILTDQNEYIVPSAFLMLYHYSDKLYWILKDYFKDTNIFLNEFGTIFENYVYEILVKQYGVDNVIKIPRVEGEKSADFLIESTNFIFLIEVKSGMARVGAKKASLDRNALDFFIKNNIVDAMEQLDASSKKYGQNKKIICMAVNYDNIYTEDSLLFQISDLYNPTNFSCKNFLLFGIDRFEEFIYKYNTIPKLESLYNDQEIKVHNLVDGCEIVKNYFFEDIFNVDLNLLTKKRN